MADQTLYNKWELPLSHERNLEAFLRLRLVDIDAALGNDFITGLRLDYLGNNDLRVQPGVAYVQGVGRVRVTAAIDKTGLMLSAGAFNHVYLYSNAGVPSVEVVTTPPTGYFGTAYQKQGDGTRRYLGSVLTNSSSQLFNWQHNPLTGFMRYRVNAFQSPFQLLVAQTQTTETTKSASTVAPVTARQLLAYVQNTTPSASAYFGNSEDSVAIPGGGGLSVSESGKYGDIQIMLDAAQAFSYAFNAAVGSGGLYVTALGYWFIR